MTKVEISPGICGLTATVTATSEDGADVTVTVDSPCKAVTKMMEVVGSDLDAYEICFDKPGNGPIYEAASEHLSHMACPVAAGIVKCIEAECKLALPKDAYIKFVD